MRICFIELQPFPTTVGGGITHLEELSKALLRSGHEVSIITSKPEKRFRLDAELKKVKLYHVGLPHKKLENFKGIKRFYYFLWRAFFELRFILDTREILKKENFDIIEAQSAITPSIPPILAGKEFYITAHGIHNLGFKRLYSAKNDFFSARIGAKIYELIENFTIKRAKKIICLGKETFDYYSKENSCVIIPNGVDLDKFSPGKAPPSKAIIYVGRFTEQKAIDKLVLAMDNLPDYSLKIIGLGPLESKIKKMCEKRKNCKFLGYKTQNEIPGYLQKAQLTVLPSLFEGLPIAMLEAMACGVVPISTAVGDIPDLIKDGKNGFLLKNNTPEEIVKTVKRSEKTNLNKVRDSCIDTIKKSYSWDSIAKRYLKTWKID